MKNFFWVILLLLFMISCGSDHENVYGYIPVEQTAKYLWYQTPSLKYGLDPRIMVISKVDTIMASFNREGFFSGSLMVLYKDTYPPAVRRKVFVKLLKMDNDVYYIQEASLDSFKIN